MPECKDIIYYIISVIGIIVTGIFSYLVWKATKKSTQVAQESYNLSQSIINSQAKLKANIRDQFISKVLSNANVVLEILTIQRSQLTLRMERIPKSCGLSETELAEYFEQKEREIIYKAWEMLNGYIEKYINDSTGKIRKSFYDEEADHATKATIPLIQTFTSLINSLDVMKKGGNILNT